MRVVASVSVAVSVLFFSLAGPLGAQGIFSSGFESGTTCEWSATVPQPVEEEAPPTHPSWWCDGLDNDCDGDVDEAPWPTLTLYDVLPRVLYRFAETPVTLYVSNHLDEIAGVWIEEDATGSVTAISSSNWTWAPDQPHVVLALIPAGLAEGSYSVGIEDAAGCGSSLGSALHIESSETLSVNSVEPTFAEMGQATHVEIFGTGFAELPDIYIVPPAGAAEPLYSATYIDATTLTAIVPEHVGSGLYDIVVVNSNGSLGVGVGLLTVSPLAGPTITAVSPPRVHSGLTEAVHIDGADFRSPTVHFECIDLAGTGLTIVDGVGTTSTPTTIDTSLPTTSLTAGDKCVVRVTNYDGTYHVYSLVSVTNPAGTVYSITAGPAMNTARRAPAVVAARATPVDRFLYAIGGDHGDTSSALSTVEVAAIGPFGRLGTWLQLADGLPAARTLAEVVRVDRFLYLVGGHDGTELIASALRAEVLDPSTAPTLDTALVELNIVGNSGQPVGGLPPGTYRYRLSAWFDLNDLDTPGGESLAGPPLVVRVPTINQGDPDNNNGVFVTVSWTAVSGAESYRLYRTPVADSGSGTEELLAVVQAVSNPPDAVYFFDDYTVTTSLEVPVDLGSLSPWRELDFGFYFTARIGACAAAGSDPDPNDSLVYLYVAGGMDDIGNLRSAIDVIAIDRESGYPIGPSEISTVSLEDPRWLCDATTVDRELHPVACDAGDCTSWVYFGPGEAAGGLTSGVEAGEVGSDGDLVNWAPSAGSTGGGGRAGYGMSSADDHLYVFGGQAGSALSASGREAELDTSNMPNIVSFNAFGGITMAEPRYLPGTATESGYHFVVGGQTDTENPPTVTATIDVVPY